MKTETTFSIERILFKDDWGKSKYLVMEAQRVNGKVQTLINHWEHLQDSFEDAEKYIQTLKS